VKSTLRSLGKEKPPIYWNMVKLTKKSASSKKQSNRSSPVHPSQSVVRRTQEEQISDSSASESEPEEVENPIVPEQAIEEFHEGDEMEEDRTIQEDIPDRPDEPRLVDLPHSLANPQSTDSLTNVNMGSMEINPHTGLTPREAHLNRLLVETSTYGLNEVTQGIRSELERLMKMRLDRLAPIGAVEQQLVTTHTKPKPSGFVKPKAHRSIRPVTRQIGPVPEWPPGYFPLDNEDFAPNRTSLQKG
jgi:hypothetical protein